MAKLSKLLCAGFYAAPLAYLRPGGGKAPHAVRRWADVHQLDNSFRA
jgi:hypothetical protein